jgi:long-subunit acyl-CoA synthetase (AMP-forming)
LIYYLILLLYLQLGLEPFHGVGIIGFNSPEWLISDIGAVCAGYEANITN